MTGSARCWSVMRTVRSEESDVRPGHSPGAVCIMSVVVEEHIALGIVVKTVDIDDLW